MAETDKNVIGIAMQLDVTDLKSGLAEVNKEIKQSKDDFAAVTSSMDNWQKSTDGVTAKLNQLNTQLNAQAKAIAGYKAEIERVSKLEGDHTATLDRLRAKLTSAEQSFKVTSGQIKRYEASLAALKKQNITNSINAAQSALSKFGNELKKVTKAQLAQNVAMLANPYALAASAVGFLIGKVSEYVKQQREANEVSKEDVEIKEQQARTTLEYTAAIQTFSAALSRTAKSYSESIAQERAFQKSLDDIKSSIVENGFTLTQYANTLDTWRRQIKDGGFYDFSSGEFLPLDEATLAAWQKNLDNAKKPLIELAANMIDLGKTESDVSAILSQLGIDQEFVNEIFRDATKAVEEWNAANKKIEQKKDTKPVEFYSTTQLAEDKKHYEEWAKLREAREYKLATLDNSLTEAQRVKALKAIDDEMAKHDDYVKRYLQAQTKMKLAGEETFDSVQKAQEKSASSAETFADKFAKAWTGKIESIGLSAQQIFNAIGDVATKIGETVGTVIDSISTYWDNYYAERKQELEDEAAAETEQREHDLSEIERQYMNYEITLDEFKTKKAAIEADITNNEGSEEDERQKKKEELEREEDQRKREIFEAQKATNIAMLWIQSSIGQVTALVNAIRDLGFPAGPIVGGITAGAILTQTIAETVAMASQQYVSAFAKGGIVNRPTLGLVGEAGKEAIMPLENNTEWITDLARKIAVIQRTDLSAGISGGNNYSYGGDTINNNRSNYNYTQNIYAPKTPSRLDLYRDGKRLLTIGRGR